MKKKSKVSNSVKKPTKEKSCMTCGKPTQDNKELCPQCVSSPEPSEEEGFLGGWGDVVGPVG